MNPLSGALACFFCGVDSRVTLYFFIAFCVCVVGGGLFLLGYAITRGDFKNLEQPKYDIFKNVEDRIPSAPTQARKG